MALTTARKRANAKYEAKAYDKTLIRLPKGRLDEIRAHIEPAGESLNGFIGRAITEAMARDGADGPQETAGQAARAGMVSLLSPDTLEAVQKAAEVTRETPADFIARAIETQVQRDKSSLRMGLNPVTGDKLEKEA